MSFEGLGEHDLHAWRSFRLVEAQFRSPDGHTFNRTLLRHPGAAAIVPVDGGDVVFVRTGWGEHWRDPDTEKLYYSKAPGLSYDAAQWLAGKRIVAIGLDTPFVDTVPEGMLAGKAGPAAGTPPGLPFAVHHHMLSQAGIHLIENARLEELAAERVWLSCAMILPLRDKGAAGSALRPVAIGAGAPTRAGRR